jgi:rod shape-determining protein MreC
MIGLVLALPLLSINMQQTPQGSHWLSRPFSLLSSSIGEVFFGFSHGIKDTTGMYVNLIGIKKDNEHLQSNNSELQTRLEKMTELQLENDRLRDLLAFKESTKMQLTAAQVIGRDLVIDHNTITINKGLRDGIKSGQAVITTTGALGYVF